MKCFVQTGFISEKGLWRSCTEKLPISQKFNQGFGWSEVFGKLIHMMNLGHLVPDWYLYLLKKLWTQATKTAHTSWLHINLVFLSFMVHNVPICVSYNVPLSTMGTSWQKPNMSLGQLIASNLFHIVEKSTFALSQVWPNNVVRHFRDRNVKPKVHLIAH